MASGVYVAVAGQVALERRLETIANNVANMNTAGFRADGVKFDTMVSTAGSDPVAFPSGGTSYISRKAGPLNQTGNPLDVAVDGEGWFALKAGDKTVYTRDGRMHLTDLGEVQSVNGYSLLDPGGAPVIVDPNAGPVQIASDGTISQGGQPVGAIGLFLIPETAQLSRFDNSAVIPSEPAVAAEDLTTNGIRQGYVEGSNVNPVAELTKLIEVSRAFENAVAAAQTSDTTTQDAIRDLGAG